MHGVGFWKAINERWDEFNLQATILIGNDKRTKDWLDRWIGRVP